MNFKTKKNIALLTIVIVGVINLYCRIPIVTGDWNKQTFYLWCLNCFRWHKGDAKPKILLIDDDSGKGVFTIKKICDELSLKATFAVIPALMGHDVRDSLRNWQKEGFGIAIHGYKHEDWREWNYNKVIADINKCEKWLTDAGFRIRDIKYVVTPHGSNNTAIRKAIKDKGYQMVTGANIVNPDTSVFQMGRVYISRKTNIKEIENILNKAKKRKFYVILGTHSSMPDIFSEEKTKAVLQMAKDMGYEFYY